MKAGAGNLWRHVSEHPLWSALLAALVIAGAGALLHSLRGGGDSVELPPAGWGPMRSPYWCKRPTACDGADHVVFNSYANAPNYGDERAFVDAKPASHLAPGDFRDVLAVEPGETVLVRLYVDNAAWAARLGRRDGMARGTEARAEVPLAVDRRHEIFGYVTARNARPRVVWDGVTLESDEETTVRYVFGSARWWTRHRRAGLPVSDALMEEGTPIGSWRLDGRFGDSFADSGLLTFRVRVEAAGPDSI
ncbi:MAG TPA: hypothetical protein VGI73_13690 [Solirubrobacterales bacterium]|jgi:hypothetical protein